MLRTTIMLSASLKNRAEALASKKGISFGELIRTSLEKSLIQAKTTKQSDPFFNDTHFFDGDIPTDLSTKHDEYLYDDIH